MVAVNNSAIHTRHDVKWQNSVLLFYGKSLSGTGKKRAPDLHQIENTVWNYLQSEMHFLPKIAANNPHKR